YDSPTVSVLDVATGSVRDLTPTANHGEIGGSNNLSAPVFSPDGSRVAFFWLENDTPEGVQRYRFAEGAHGGRRDHHPVRRDRRRAS
ncbi:MAG: hypothetical protein PGN13_15360, partial [Patulibacter minatonensis]